MDPQLLRSVLGIALGLATLITLALTGWSIIAIAPLAATAGMVLLSGHLTGKLKTLTTGATNCALPVVNTCADVAVRGTGPQPGGDPSHCQPGNGRTRRHAAQRGRHHGTGGVGLTHKQAYKPIFMLVVVTPILTNAFAIAIATAIH